MSTMPRRKMIPSRLYNCRKLFAVCGLLCFMFYLYNFQNIIRHDMTTNYQWPAISYIPPIIKDLKQQQQQHQQQQKWLYPTGLPTELPSWVKNYVAWHREMRSKYPGASLILDPSAPPVLVRICLGLCGGLHDRLGQLPLDLYLANQTGRVLLILWLRKEVPLPLEEFLIPPEWGIDWTFPKDVPGWTTQAQVRSQPSVAQYLQHDTLTSFQDFFSNFSSKNNVANEERVVTFAILGHLWESVLEQRLLSLGEIDTIHNTTSFGNIFWTFFKPHPNVQREFELAYNQSNLVVQQYTVVHCRVRHPKAHGYNKKYTDTTIPLSQVDKVGLPFVGEMKEFAVQMATHALKCASTVLQTPQEPICFLSDSNDLVNYVRQNLTMHHHSTPNIRLVEINATTISWNIKSREQPNRNMHIDKTKGGQIHEYYGVFVDLLLGIHARCVVYGVGFYALFAAKISGTPCRLVHSKEQWGDSGYKDLKNDEVCTEDTYKHLV